MKKLLLIASYAICGVLLTSEIFAQHTRKKIQTDADLQALEKKFLHTPTVKSIDANGDVFLQRNMDEYLGATILKNRSAVDPNHDFGDDHNSEVLAAFLNRPHPSVATLTQYFNDAAAEFAVPAVLLMATAQVQSNWTQVSESMYGSWGVMGIIENPYTQQISQAAGLLNVTADDIKNDAKTNIRAAAALLKQYQGNNLSPNIEDWFEAVRSLTGLTDESMKKSLALRIYDVVNNGSKSITLWGEIINLNPIPVSLPKSITEPEITTAARSASVDYPNAIANFTTCNFNNRPIGSVVKYYFIHYIATGTYQGAISWFKNCTSQASAHYVISNNGEVNQVVAEDDRAWTQGVTTYNDLGIGVEHEVLASNLAMWDSDPMLTAAANLCINVCNRRGIPKTRRVNNGDMGIYGHSDVKVTDCPNLTATRWTNFLNRLNTVNAAAPLLYSVSNPGAGSQVTATWKANVEPTLLGYRLYYATNDALTNWALAANETTLTAATTSITLSPTQFVVPPSQDVYHFKLTAVVSNGTNPAVESSGSDIYSRSSNTAGPTVLIVDGFDRTSGSYTASTHSFVASYFKALRNKANLQVSSVANERVEDGTVQLSNYNMVVWFVGDESTNNIPLSTTEKSAITAFLNGGGKLFISGSEVAYSIGRTASALYDPGFMNNYLKSGYVSDGAISYSPATGIAATPFAGITIPFGVVYTEDFPDGISAMNGSVSIMSYNVAPYLAGVAYTGTFGSGTTPGALVYLSYTLETAADSSMVMAIGKTLDYFGVSTFTIATANDDAATAQTASAKRINVLSNDYGNGVAINPASLIIVTPPANGTVTKDNNGNVTYVSNPAFAGNDSYQYKVQNVNGQFSNVATVNLIVVSVSGCNPSAIEVEDMFPKRDLRGAWVSTVSNIDWPSSRTLTTSQAQLELIKILDTLARTGINTVFLQVRPESDALYASAIEPWSYWLTNAQGTAPNPLWDPLAFAVTEAHKRGMELHAWLNPYRAKQSTPTLAANHVATLHPDWTFTSGTLTMLDPGLPQVRTHLTQVIADIATRYDIDGIHFDDYFYPSAGMTGQDNTTYANNNPTGIATIEDWRRNNVNLLIAKVYDTIAVINAASNKNIVFGVSPFGIWKSGTPAGISGTSSFSAMYCDPIAWLQAGKVDYVAPQLYWKITGAQDYDALSKWWNDQGLAYNRFIYPGLALYKMSDANNWAATEIENQITLNRNQQHDQVKGQIYFSTKQIMSDVKGIKTSLQNIQQRYRSLVPALPWKDAVCPNAPVNVRQEADTLRWNTPAAAADGDLPKKYVVYKFSDATQASTHINDGTKIYAIVADNKLGLPLADVVNSYFVVTALDKNNNESEAIVGVVLPATGLELFLKSEDERIVINWKTITEVNTNYFEVQRSNDGRDFTTIGSEPAAGYSNAPKNYSKYDQLSTSGTYYYRIKLVDRDGRFSYSEVKSTMYEMNGKEITAGPNPFNSQLVIRNAKDVRSLDVLDMSGKLILRNTYMNRSQIVLECNHLPAGVYTIRMINSKGFTTYLKVSKH